MTTPPLPRPLEDRDQHQKRVDHATWIMERRRENRCICKTCWEAHLAGRRA